MCSSAHFRTSCRSGGVRASRRRFSGCSDSVSGIGKHLFSASAAKPRGRRCRPRFRRPPSISMRRRACGQAKSALRRRGGAKRYSRCRSGPPAASRRVAKRVSGSEMLRRSCTRLNVLSKLRAFSDFVKMLKDWSCLERIIYVGYAPLCGTRARRPI